MKNRKTLSAVSCPFCPDKSIENRSIQLEWRNKNATESNCTGCFAREEQGGIPGPAGPVRIEKKARILFAEYIKAEAGKPRAITIHTIGKIYPCVAFYKAASEYTDASEQVYAIIEEFFEEESAVNAKKLQKLCRFPFVYRLVPRVMAGIIHRYFGARSGFEMIDHGTKRNVCHIDMIKCPYFSACTEHGCPELTTVFCNADDIAYGNMHANLSWDRKKTLGRGDDRCDFILRVVKQKT